MSPYFRVTSKMEYRPNWGSEKGITKSHYYFNRPSGSEDIGPDDDSHNFPQTISDDAQRYEYLGRTETCQLQQQSRAVEVVHGLAIRHESFPRVSQ